MFINKSSQLVVIVDMVQLKGLLGTPVESLDILSNTLDHLFPIVGSTSVNIPTRGNHVFSAFTKSGSNVEKFLWDTTNVNAGSF